MDALKDSAGEVGSNKESLLSWHIPSGGGDCRAAVLKEDQQGAVRWWRVRQ